MSDADTTPEGVATEKENARLEHSQGGTTTRDDALDVGVPMLPGSPDEPQGPEDALGPGPKRGDYSDRVGPAGYNPTESVPNDEPSTKAEREAAAAGTRPTAKIQAQRPRASDQGEVAGRKGGVDTADASA